MGYNPQAVTAAFQRLFRTYPQFATDELKATMQVYFEAVAPYETIDIEAAVQSFITGAAPGHNHAFAPSAPMVGGETRRLMNLRVDREARDRAFRPQLPPPMVEHTPESRAAIKAMVDEVIERAAEQHRTEQATKRKNDIWERTNDRFAPDMDPAAMRKRLHLSIGDPEDHEAAA